MLLLGSSAYSQFDQPTYIMPPHHSRIAPYMDSMYVDPNDNTLITPPLFETYFDTAYYVTDSFYFGTTNHNGALADGIHARGLCLNGFSIEYPVNTNIATTIKVYNSGDYVRWRRFPYRPGILLAFPILTPDPNRSTPTPVDTVLSYFDTTAIDTTIIDTTGQGGDTTGVDTTGAAIYSPQLLERYTQLIPSVVEVGGTATVLSSFHLQAVELYDAAGRLVQSRPARGTAATVDCTALPRGSYLVRLVTTAGTTTKKLTVR
ncbi:MAG: T9SS type A sorting domain-containing protein [Bacteroidales bacterium]|nr:T9SS type A sorting domain-containing protein [Bacteroidales bacterium]